MKAIETRNSKLTNRSSRLFAAVCLLTLFGSSPFEMKGQAIFATTPDSPIYPTNVGCSGSFCLNFLYPFAEMGNGVYYDLQYANSGSFKVEYAGQTRCTWVTDYESNDWIHPKRAIANWDNATGGTTGGYTELNIPNNIDEDEFDPDVVQLDDSLYTVYYTIHYFGSNLGFPGNGNTSSSDYRVRFESFGATDSPSLGSNHEIQVTPIIDLEYAKSPNIDVSLAGDVVVAWEEKNVNEAKTHIYVKAYDATSGLYNTNFLDIDPDDFEGYSYFYNPDIAASTLEGLSIQPADNPVYITFMSNTPSGVKLLVYTATVNDIKTSASTSTSNLTVLATLPTLSSVAVGDYLRDYLYRPRIASHPKVWFDGINVHEKYSVVVPKITSTGSTDIVSYTMNSGSLFATVHTQMPASNTDISCVLNYEPCTEVNDEGYEVIWISDQGQLLSGWSPNSPLANPVCYALTTFYEETILRKRIDWIGSSFYPDYSIVPDYIHKCCWTYGPSLAYERNHVVGGPSGPFGNQTMFGFQYGFNAQWTYYKFSTYTNTSMKWANDQSKTSTDPVENSQLQTLDGGRWVLNLENGWSGYDIRDMQGRLIYAASNASQNNRLSIDLHNQPNGMYFLNVKQLNGLKTVKLVHVE